MDFACDFIRVQEFDLALKLYEGKDPCFLLPSLGFKAQG